MEPVSNKNDEGEIKNKKLKIKKIKSYVSNTLPVLIGIIIIITLATIVIHLVLFALSASVMYVDDLDYCEYKLGKGWLMDTNALQSQCIFKQENGSYKIEPITKEQIESRYCKRKFYQPSYCGV